LQELLMQVQRTPASDDGDNNLQQTIQALASFTVSEKIEGICKALAAELKDAQEKRETALMEEMEKTFADSLRTALTGKTAKEIDAPLARWAS